MSYYFQHNIESVNEGPPIHIQDNEYIAVNFPMYEFPLPSFFTKDLIIFHFQKVDGSSLKKIQISTHFTDNIW